VSQPEDWSTTVSVIVSGMPSATPSAEPKLFVMSRRTTPLSLRTFGPFEPSPGYGPAVSLGMTSQSELDVPEEEEPEEDASDAAPESSVEQAATSGTMLAPASSLIMRRRANTGRSWESPLSNSSSWWWPLP
jgi:hypothetical protein